MRSEKESIIKWSWTSVAIGAAAATLILIRPKDPTFHLISLKLTSFSLDFPSLDMNLILTVQITNPNICPITYSSTKMSIFYHGSPLGSAQVQAGSQPSNSTRVLQLPARLSGVRMACHVAEFARDLRRREMRLEAEVDIEGWAKVMWWEHRFRVHVDSHVTVDPLFLEVVDEESIAKMDLLVLDN